MHSEAIDQGAETSPKVNSEQPSTPTASLQKEVMKVGERQSQTNSATDEVVAKVHSHELDGRQASTLYVRNIPVLTFLGAEQNDLGDVKIGTQVPNSLTQPESSALTKSLANTADLLQVQLTTPSQSSTKSAPTATDTHAAQNDDPLWRAAEVAARLNHLNRDGLDASKITVIWDTTSQKPLVPKDDPDGISPDRYFIKVNNDVLVTIDTRTLLSDTTRDLEQDALQVTNRLRRLLGNAEPLNEVAGRRSRKKQAIALGPIQFQVNGWASWYGPGFHGNQSASGEIFDQNAMTAAHRTLPFGTQVMVTNLDNGQSVLVRINDRGPFYGNRVIDLSAAAARVLGLMNTGIAPVRLDVMKNRQVTGN